MNALFARHALLPGGWQQDVLVEWDEAGDLVRVAPGMAAEGVPQAGFVVPGMVNLHSHAFQRAMGGLTERAGDGPDSFWTWRELMYRFASRITPEQVEAIATQLYVECLRHGYTSVCEFHYLHHDPEGRAYAPASRMLDALAAAGSSSGIGVTLLPVLYSYAGFGAQPLAASQRRFATGVDDVLGMVQACSPLRSRQLEVGAAPHSLRAASVEQVRALAAGLPAERPLHIHIAEQQAEVAQCLAATGQRPVAYLMAHVDVDARWCLVHATHLDETEVMQLARSGAVAGLCPSTEANLGDGLFALAPYIAAGGQFGIGSDSHVSHSPIEELRWLEYGQRLQQQSRNVAATPAQKNVADYLWQQALAGGAQATGRAVGQLAAGSRADLLVLDDAHPNLDAVTGADVLGRLLFCGNDNLVRDVLCGGRWVVRNGRHPQQDAIAQRFCQAVRALREENR